MVAKIIDFGRNRMECPSQEDHIDISGGGNNRHYHDSLTCSKGMDAYGYPCDQANRQIDVKLFLLGVLDLWSEVNQALTKEEKQPFYDMCDRVIDFDRINRIVRDFYYGQYRGGAHINPVRLEYEWKSVGKVSAENYHKCREVQKLLKVVGSYDEEGNLQKGVFIYRLDEEEDEMGSVATDVLNDPFFDEYKLEALVPDHSIPEEEIYSIKSEHIVVSFIAHPEEAMMLGSHSSSDGGGDTMRCCMCNAPSAKYIAGDDLFCGGACYDFKHLFDSKTVYR
jgi:hypothetical protein